MSASASEEVRYDGFPKMCCDCRVSVAKTVPRAVPVPVPVPVHIPLPVSVSVPVPSPVPVSMFVLMTSDSDEGVAHCRCGAPESGASGRIGGYGSRPSLHYCSMIERIPCRTHCNADTVFPKCSVSVRRDECCSRVTRSRYLPMATSRTSLCWTVRTGWLLLSVVMLVASTHSHKLPANRKSDVCQSLDIRNTPETFERLRGCRVVEGFVQILLFDKTEESLYTNITFPELTEITDYLLLYRVNGLRTLGTLFPNLTVIRGQKTFFGYSFILFEMSSLQEIGLYSLTDIVQGSVRIDKNPSLCYVNTIDWERITHEKGEHFIARNKMQNECPICPGDDGNEDGMKCHKVKHRDPLSSGPAVGRHLCWNRHHCQKVCPENCGRNSCNEDRECCSESCIGGCSGIKRDECTVCRHFTIGTDQDRKCLKTCPNDTYQFLKRRCISKEECYNMKRPVEHEREVEDKPYKPFNGSCVLECPANYFETKTNGFLTCEPCKGKCRKSCPGASVDSINSAGLLRGCTHIEGSLEIQIRGGRNIVKELEENLNMIEEIDGYLKIVRSFPLMSLNFFKNLREIHGNSLESGKYVFIVLDNQNLQELWDWEKQNRTLKIHKGRLFFHFNPKLCLYEIERLRRIANLDDFSDLEVAPTSNGDKVACNVTELKVTISSIKDQVAILTWPQFKMDDPRSLLGYVVYRTEAPYKNITLYDGRDACGGDGWHVDDVNIPDSLNSSVFHLMPQLKPYTQYAFYVKTYTIATERSGAQSPIYYFRTKPSVPTPPVNLRVHAPSSNKLVIQWQPPSVPNGNVTYYNINAICTPDNQDLPQQRNYCHEPLTFEDDKKPSIIIKTDETTVKDSNDTCACNITKPKDKQEKIKENDRVSQINFEDELHNRVYIKRGEEPRRKREIDIQHAKKLVTSDKSLHDYSTIRAAETTNQSKNGSCTPMKYVVRGNTSFVMEDLPHFKKYIISVQACREREENDTGPFCSHESIVPARTLKAEGVDNITRVEVTVTIANSSLGMVHLTWEEPKNPNSIILTYQIEYRRLDIENYKPMIECIPQFEYNKDKKYILKNLPAGNYSIRIMATSLAGNGVYTPYKYFFITEVKSGSTAEIVFGIVAAVLVTCVAGIVVFYLRRRFTPNVPNMKLIASVNPEYVSTVYVPDDWEVPRKKIELLRELGQGSFGMVYEGIARDVVKGKPEMRCAIKTVNEHATDRERIEFLNEASVMKAFDTTHVVRLLGVVSQGQPTLVVMELMANGDLKSYLRSHRPDAESYNPTSSRQPPTLKRILQMAIEIADGMAYLAAKKFVHRDLAARNCMVAEDLTVKIGDFGMTRDIYETDYYRKGTKGLLPVRWMAPESLKDGVFTSNSDVWSYGVVLWEMATLASQPYQGLSNDQVLRYVIDGGIMERPENCPDKLYHLMRVCWQHKPSLRPSFLDLATMILEDAAPSFKQLSFYHSTAGIEARTIHNAAQDDPSTPLRLTKEIEDFSLGSGSEQESEPEDLGDDGIDSDFDGKHVTINFPGFQVASFRGSGNGNGNGNGNQKSLEASDASLYSYKDNNRSEDSAGPSFSSYPLKRSIDSLQDATSAATANGFVVGQSGNNALSVPKTTRC